MAEPVRVAAPRRRRGLTILATVLLLAALVMLPVVIGAEVAYLEAAQHVLIGVVGGIGLTLLVGQAGRLSLAHPFFLLVGAVGYAVLAGAPTRGPGPVGLGLPPLLAVLGAVAVSGLCGLAFAPVAGRLHGSRFGAASLSLVILGGWLGRSLGSLTGGATGGRPAPRFELFGLAFADGRPAPMLLGVPIGEQQRLWYLFLAFAVLAYFLARGAVRGRIGRAWRAVRDDEAAAVAMGVDVFRVRAGAFTVASGFAGLAGVMTALWLDRVQPDDDVFTGTYSLTAAVAYLAVVLVGGLGSLPGAVVGAIVVFGLPQFLPLLAGEFGWTAGGRFGGLDPGVFGAAGYGAAVVLVLLIAPGGAAAVGRRMVRPRRPLA